MAISSVDLAIKHGDFPVRKLWLFTRGYFPNWNSRFFYPSSGGELGQHETRNGRPNRTSDLETGKSGIKPIKQKNMSFFYIPLFFPFRGIERCHFFEEKGPETSWNGNVDRGITRSALMTAASRSYNGGLVDHDSWRDQQDIGYPYFATCTELGTRLKHNCVLSIVKSYHLSMYSADIHVPQLKKTWLYIVLSFQFRATCTFQCFSWV